MGEGRVSCHASTAANAWDGIQQHQGMLTTQEGKARGGSM
jgi:hypothetical protein